MAAFHKLAILGTVGLSVAVGSPALAADPMAPIAPVAAPVSEPYAWDGFYAGVWGGYRSGTVNNTDCAGVCGDDFPIEGLFGGVIAGYDAMIGSNTVVGGFVSVPVLAPDGTTEVFGDTWTADPNFAVIAGGRLGYAVDRALPYVFAGVAMASVTTRPPDFPIYSDSTALHFGGVVGAGLEYAVTDNVSLDARYMFGYAAPAEYTVCALAGCESSYEETSHNFSIGVNYRF